MVKTLFLEESIMKMCGFTKHFVSGEPRFEDEIYLPKLKLALKAHGMDR